MPKLVSEGKLLYHLTALDNLDGIMTNGLCARSLVKPKKDVADKEIITKRAQLGILDYVPFHFMALSPFAGSVQLSNPNKDFAYITVSRYTAILHDFKIIPTHPLHVNPEGFVLQKYSIGYSQINWTLMNMRAYQIPESKQTCMAECLAFQMVPLNFVRFIFVKDQKTCDKLTKKYDSQCKLFRIQFEAQPAFFC